MNAREIAEQIARDTSCAQGEFHRRVLAIMPYLTDAADERKRLQEALKPLASLNVPRRPDGNAGFYSIRYSDIERAQQAYEQHALAKEVGK